MTKLKGFFALCAWVFSCSALAHFPTLSCEKITKGSAQQLSCIAGYSDGSLPGEVTLKVFDYDENLLHEVKTATDGSATTPFPQSDFFVIFDASHESPAEFDSAELE